MTRADLEARDNWQATFELVRRPGRCLCLMMTAPNRAARVGYYWHEPEYAGAFAWGATSSYLGDESLRYNVDNQFYKLVAGRLPWEACLLYTSDAADE